MLLVKPLCGKQGIERHGKDNRHLAGQLFGILGEIKPSVGKRSKINYEPTYPVFGLHM